MLETHTPVCSLLPPNHQQESLVKTQQTLNRWIPMDLGCNAFTASRTWDTLHFLVAFDSPKLANVACKWLFEINSSVALRREPLCLGTYCRIQRQGSSHLHRFKCIQLTVTHTRMDPGAVELQTASQGSIWVPHWQNYVACTMEKTITTYPVVGQTCRRYMQWSNNPQ